MLRWVRASLAGVIRSSMSRRLPAIVHSLTGQAISPPALVEVVRQYRPDYLQEARQIIKWYIHRLRRKVEPDPSDPRYIVNVRGVGYMLET